MLAAILARALMIAPDTWLYSSRFASPGPYTAWLASTVVSLQLALTDNRSGFNIFGPKNEMLRNLLTIRVEKNTWKASWCLHRPKTATNNQCKICNPIVHGWLRVWQQRKISTVIFQKHRQSWYVRYCIRYLVLIFCPSDGHAAQLVHNQPVHFYKPKMTILK